MPNIEKDVVMDDSMNDEKVIDNTEVDTDIMEEPVEESEEGIEDEQNFEVTDADIFGFTNEINSTIARTLETVTVYQNTATLAAQIAPKLVDLLNSMISDLNGNVGKLQAALGTLTTAKEEIDQGVAEAEEQLDTITTNDSAEEIESGENLDVQEHDEIRTEDLDDRSKVKQTLTTDENAIFDEIINKLDMEGFDINNDDVQMYAQAAADYLLFVQELGLDSQGYSVEQWYQDTLVGYPEDFAELPRKKSMNESKVRKDQSLWDQLYDNLVSDVNIDKTKLAIPVNHSKRYDYDDITIGDNYIGAYGETKEDLDFGIQVANTLGLPYKIEHLSYVSNMPWVIKIFVSQE